MKTKIFTFLWLTLFFLSTFCLSDDKKVLPNENWLMRAKEFHGHLGPYVVLGLKAGLYANHTLGRAPMHTSATIKTKTSPPQSCFVDGVQLTTGCTFGKRNISLEEGEGLEVTFLKENKKLTLILKKEILEELESLPTEEQTMENLAKKLYSRAPEDLFDIKK